MSSATRAPPAAHISRRGISKALRNPCFQLNPQARKSVVSTYVDKAVKSLDVLAADAGSFSIMITVNPDDSNPIIYYHSAFASIIDTISVTFMESYTTFQTTSREIGSENLRSWRDIRITHYQKQSLAQTILGCAKEWHDLPTYISTTTWPSGFPLSPRLEAAGIQYASPQTLLESYRTVDGKSQARYLSVVLKTCLLKYVVDRSDLNPTSIGVQIDELLDIFSSCPEVMPTDKMKLIVSSGTRR